MRTSSPKRRGEIRRFPLKQSPNSKRRFRAGFATVGSTAIGRNRLCRAKAPQNAAFCWAKCAECAAVLREEENPGPHEDARDEEAPVQQGKPVKAGAVHALREEWSGAVPAG